MNIIATDKKPLTAQYNERFYNSQMDGSYRSASEYVKYLSQLYQPESVIDFGCGRGTWLKAFKDIGVERLVGLDGKWNSQGRMVEQSIKFVPVDLNGPVNISEKFDIAISLEVAEHLKDSSADSFVNNMIASSDVVMFGAAYPSQGGTDHMNEQPPTYWANIFLKYGYVPYDIFRPVFWGSPTVSFWYQQNTFLYVRSSSRVNETLKNMGHKPILNTAFMNCVHPTLYNLKLSSLSVKSMVIHSIKKAIPKRLYPVALRIKDFLT